MINQHPTFSRNSIRAHGYICLFLFSFFCPYKRYTETGTLYYAVCPVSMARTYNTQHRHSLSFALLGTYTLLTLTHALNHSLTHTLQVESLYLGTDGTMYKGSFIKYCTCWPIASHSERHDNAPKSVTLTDIFMCIYI